jgi:ABC-type spermidine/putrescine transport system permease subunit II
MNFAFWTTYWLFTQTIAITVYAWPVSLVLGLNALAATAFSRVPKHALQRLALATPFVWPMLILGVAGACWYTGPGVNSSAIPTIGVTMIFGIQLLLSLGIVYQLAGNRWFTASVCLIAGWFGLISWFLAGMALTNVWL